MREIMPELKVIMLTIHDLEEYRIAAMDAGACAYILKKSLMKDLNPAINAVYDPKTGKIGTET